MRASRAMLLLAEPAWKLPAATFSTSAQRQQQQQQQRRRRLHNRSSGRVAPPVAVEQKVVALPLQVGCIHLQLIPMVCMR